MMYTRGFATLLFLLSASTGNAASTTTPESPQESIAIDPNAAGFLINFNNVNISEYLRFASRISGKNFIFDPAELNFNVTIVSEERTSIAEIMAALMQELRIHNFMLMEEGNNVIIHANPDVNSPSTVIYDNKIPSGAQVVTRVFLLNSFPPEKAVQIIKPLLSTFAVFEPLPETSHLILTDISTNVDKVAGILKTLDSPASGLEIGRFSPKNVLVEPLQIVAEKILMPLAEGKSFTLVPYPETNILYVISTPNMVERSLELLQDLDTGFGKGSQQASGSASEEERRRNAQENYANSAAFPGNFNPSDLASSLPRGHIHNTEFAFYKLNYRKGDEIQNALQQIALSMGNTDNGISELVAAIQTVQWIDSSNTLVFTGTKAANTKIRELIKDLDISSQQVLIEMLILETTIDDALEFGVDYMTNFSGPSSGGAQGNLTALSPLPAAMQLAYPTYPAVDASSMIRNAGFKLGVIGRNITKCGITFSSIGALVNALHDDLDSEVVLNPKIVVEENKPAEIFVGLNVPFKTQSIANDFGTTITNNFEYRDIGTTLKVTPIIGKNGIITLEIEEEMSSLVTPIATITASAFDSNTGSGPTTRKSKTSTTIFVPDGYFVILSGMIHDDTEKRRSQVPCLGGIPVMGAAFSQKRNRSQKRNLMLFIRPSLMNDKDAMCELTKREQDMLDAKNSNNHGWDYEVHEALDLFNITPPCPGSCE